MEIEDEFDKVEVVDVADDEEPARVILMAVGRG